MQKREQEEISLKVQQEIIQSEQLTKQKSWNHTNQEKDY